MFFIVFMSESFFSQSKASESYGYNSGLRAYMNYVYMNMGLALGVSGIVAFVSSLSASFMQMIFGTPLKFVVMFAPLVLAFVFAFRISKMSFEAARGLFFVYAALMGLSLSSIFLVYTSTSIVTTFLITAITFGSMSLYGYLTKKDLTGMGSFLMMGLWGIMIAMVVNIFLKSTGLQFVVSILGVVIFTGLTAYDTQRIKQMYYSFGGTDIATAKKVSIMAALQLYMDFVNLFIMLLQFFGDRKE